MSTDCGTVGHEQLTTGGSNPIQSCLYRFTMFCQKAGWLKNQSIQHLGICITVLLWQGAEVKN